MSKHLSEQMIEGYCQRRMTPAELLAIDDHVILCDVCRRQLFQRERLTGVMISLQPELHTQADTFPEHLSYRQFAGHIDDLLDGADCEIVTAHLDYCPECSEEMRDLLAFKDSLEVEHARAFS